MAILCALLAGARTTAQAQGPPLPEQLPDPVYESVPLPPVEDPMDGPMDGAIELEQDAAERLPLLVPELAEAVEPPPEWYQPLYWLGPGEWDSAIELGLNGTSGTNDSLSYRTGGYFKGRNDVRKLDVSLYYNSTTAEGIQTQNNSLLSGRHDWLLQSSPWSLYLLSQLFYDEFQTYDLELNINSGVGYQWIDREQLKFASRLGAGASREFGGPADRWAPEAQVGLDYQQRIFAAHKLTGKVDYFPEFEHFGRYRILSELGWEVQLSQPENLSLKVAATDRYDADPHEAKPHILNYSILLLWKP